MCYKYIWIPNKIRTSMDRNPDCMCKWMVAIGQIDFGNNEIIDAISNQFCNKRVRVLKRVNKNTIWNASSFTSSHGDTRSSLPLRQRNAHSQFDCMGNCNVRGVKFTFAKITKTTRTLTIGSTCFAYMKLNHDKTRFFHCDLYGWIALRCHALHAKFWEGEGGGGGAKIVGDGNIANDLLNLPMQHGNGRRDYTSNLHMHP